MSAEKNKVNGKTEETVWGKEKNTDIFIVISRTKEQFYRSYKIVQELT